MRKFPDRPWVAVGTVVVKNDQILMIRRTKEPNAGLLSLPGGAQDLAETVLEAAIRETFEETNIKADQGFVVDVIDSIHYDDKGRVEYHYSIIEICLNWVSGDPKAQDDVSEAGWFSLEQLKDETLPPRTLEMIEKALAYRSRKASLTEE